MPPRSPKSNGHVGRANRTHKEEFYEITPGSFELSNLNAELRAWEQIYNSVRPHQAVDHLTPQEFLAQARFWRKDLKSH